MIVLICVLHDDELSRDGGFSGHQDGLCILQNFCIRHKIEF